jgi:hypothetical protein
MGNQTEWQLRADRNDKWANAVRFLRMLIALGIKAHRDERLDYIWQYVDYFSPDSKQ